MYSQDTIFCGDNLAKYLGVVEIVPKKQTAIIVKGERLGAVDANKGDWVLCGKTVDTWKAGVCYRWTGGEWIPLQPEVNFATEYQACLIHLLDIPDLAQQAGHFGALFAKLLVTQKALIDNLVSNQAFIKKLVVQKLHIDTDPDSNQDFEAWFDEVNGLKINNAGKEIFKVDTAGNTIGLNCIFDNSTLRGFFYSTVFSVEKKQLSQAFFQYTTIRGPYGIYVPDQSVLEFFKSVRNTGLPIDDYSEESYTHYECFVQGRGEAYNDNNNSLVRNDVTGIYGKYIERKTLDGATKGDIKTAYGIAVFFNDGTWIQNYREIKYTFPPFSVLDLNTLVEDTFNFTTIKMYVSGGINTVACFNNLPKTKPMEPNVVWLDSNNFLRLS